MAEKNRPGQIIRLARAKRIAPETLIAEAVKEIAADLADALDELEGQRGLADDAWQALRGQLD